MTKDQKKDYPQIQWSKMSPDRNEQWVIRGENVEDVVLLREELFSKASLFEAKVDQPKPVAQAGSTRVCPIHNVDLEWGKGKNPPYKPYLFHKVDGKFCFGK